MIGLLEVSQDNSDIINKAIRKIAGTDECRRIIVHAVDDPHSKTLNKHVYKKYTIISRDPALVLALGSSFAVCWR